MTLPETPPHETPPPETPPPETALRSTLADASRDLLLGTACVGCGRPGRVLCRLCDAGLPRRGRPAWPSPTPPGLATPFAGGDYDGVLKAMVNQHKEHALLPLAAPLGRVLSDVVADLLTAARWQRDGPVVLVPVPSRRTVVRARGHDPMLRVARAATRRLRRADLPLGVRRLLLAGRPVRDQSGLGAAERAANLAGSMRCGPGPASTLAASGASVVVVDDVLTTGATAREAQRALEVTGLEVLGVATVAATRKRQDSWASLPLGEAGV